MYPLTRAGGIIRVMERPEAQRPANPFERFVRAIARVPKAEYEAEKSATEAEPRTRRGPKPKKPAA